MRFTIILGLLLLLKNCDNGLPPDTEKIPQCIQQKISQIKTEPVRNPPGSVVMITAGSKKYFYIPPYCCDAFGELWDDQCNLVCNPDGGITGQGNGICPDLKDAPRKVIWQDNR